MIGAAVKRWFDQPPSGHRPGHTLTCALADLRGAFTPCTVETSRAVLEMGGSDLQIVASERLERHFQMHIVSLELSLTVPTPVEAGIRIDIRNTGMLSRTGIGCSVSARHRKQVSMLCGCIESDRALVEAMKALDFRRCSLESTDQGWSVLLEPYGASEVVNRMPSFRRYIRMDAPQVRALAETFIALRRILSAAGHT
jgi:hypothetical protein